MKRKNTPEKTNTKKILQKSCSVPGGFMQNKRRSPVPLKFKENSKFRESKSNSRGIGEKYSRIRNVDEE